MLNRRDLICQMHLFGHVPTIWRDARAYLGQEPGGEGISSYAAVFRADDLGGLPPTYIGVGTPDLFRDEDITYAQRLMAAGVSTELHVYADGFHGFDGFAVESDAAQRFTAERTPGCLHVRSTANKRESCVSDAVIG